MARPLPTGNAKARLAVELATVAERAWERVTQIGGRRRLMGVNGGTDEDEAVYAACAQELVAFAATLVRPDDAADVVSEAVLTILAAPVWQEARDKRALLFRSVYLTSKSWHRSAGRRRARQVHAVVPDCNEPDYHETSEVTTALSALSEQQRAVVFLTYWCDLDPAGIANVLGVSEGTVRKQLARARATLREVLQ